TGAVGSLTLALGSDGGLLKPLSDVVGGTFGGGNSDNAASVLEPTLANAGQAVDNVLTVGLSELLGNGGNSLDNIGFTVATTLTDTTQQVGDGLGVGEPVHDLLTSIGTSIGGVGGDTSLGLGLVATDLGNALISAGDLVHGNAANPLGGTLASASSILPDLTQGLGADGDRKSTRLNSSHVKISYAV